MQHIAHRIPLGGKMANLRNSGEIQTERRSRGASPLHPLLLLLYFVLPVLIAFNVDLRSPLVDSFHEGEYLDNLANIHGYFAGQNAFPVFIHGPMDYLPSLLASKLRNVDHVIVLTRFLNVFAVAIVWIAWLDLSRAILCRNADRLAWSTLFFLLFLWMALAGGNDQLLRRKAFLGIRDFFLLPAIWAAVRAALSGRARFKYPLFVLSGGLAAASFYWCYDRGVISALWALGLILAFAVRGRKTASFFLALGYAAALLLLPKAHVFGTMADNGHNILYWVRNNRDVWHMFLKDKIIALPHVLGEFLLAFLVMLHALRVVFRRLRDEIGPIVLGLVGIQLLFLLKLYEMPNYPASYYTIWPSFLILILTPPELSGMHLFSRVLGECGRALESAWRGARSPQWWGIVAAIAGLATVLLSNSVVSCLVVARELVKNVPDSTLVSLKHYGVDSPDVQNAPCIFQWSNEGVFALLAKRPYCTQFPYAVYISQKDEPAVLLQLQRTPPALIVYDSPNWSMNIYGRSMKERLPRIDAFIRENYTFHEAGEDYVFATPKVK
jgi:hypothetical protein